MNEIILYTPDLNWQGLRRVFPGAAEMKVLRDEPSGGARTMLVRVAPGGEIRPHTHLAGVQHYVLEGDYEAQGQSFGPGTYRFLPKDADVAAIRTKGGVTILMIYDPIG